MGLSLVELKEGFSMLLKQADLEVLPRFVAWMDLKISEYKVNTCILLDPEYDNSSVWLQFICGNNGQSILEHNNNSKSASDPPSDYRTLKDILQREFRDHRSQIPPAAAPQNVTYSNTDDGYDLVDGVEKEGQYPHQDGSFVVEEETVLVPESNDNHDDNADENMVDSFNSSAGSLNEIFSRNSPEDIQDCCENQGKTVTINGQKYYSCKKCGKMFSHVSSLHRHIKLHKVIFGHTCNLCSRKFIRKEHFDNHKCHRLPNSLLRGILNQGVLRMCGAAENSPEEKDWDDTGIRAPPLHESAPQEQDNDLHSDSENVRMPEPLEPPPAYPGLPVLSSDIKYENGEGMEEGAGGENHEELQLNHNRGTVETNVSNTLAVPRDVYQNSAVNTGESNAYFNQDSRTSDMAVNDAVSANNQVDRETLNNHAMQARDHNNSHEQNRVNDLILLDTGKYKVEREGQRNKSFIRVTKQGKYLNLKNELQMVDGQWCFVCPHCGKRFERSSNFSRHMKLHRGVYSYICPTCKRGFFRKEHFTKHICGRRAMSHTWDRITKLHRLGEPQRNFNATAPFPTSPTSKIHQQSASFRPSYNMSNHDNSMQIDRNLPVNTDMQLQEGATHTIPQGCEVSRAGADNMAACDNSHQDFGVHSGVSYNGIDSV